MPNAPYSFHAEVGGVLDGIGAFYQAVLDDGQPVRGKTVNDIGLALEAGRRAEFQEERMRYVIRFDRPGGDEDLPDYSLRPDIASEQYTDRWIAHALQHTPELEGLRHLYWAEFVNEARMKRDPDDPNWNDMNPVEWLAAFHRHAVPRIRQETGFKMLGLSANAGEPNVEDWVGPEMKRFMQEIVLPDPGVGLAFHDGFGDHSYTEEHVRNIVPHLFGNFLYPVELYGTFPCFITECAWSYRAIPEPAKFIEDLLWLAANVYNHPAVSDLGAVLVWNLGRSSKWGDLPYDLNAMMDEILEIVTGQVFSPWTGNGYWPPDDLPGGGSEKPSTIPEESKKTYILIPPRKLLSENEIERVSDYAANGVPIPASAELPEGAAVTGAGLTMGEHPVTPSHVDFFQNVLNGLPGTLGIIMWGDRIGSGLDAAWVEENVPDALPRLVWLAQSVTGLRLTMPVVGPFKVTGRFNDARDYDRDGVADDLHEGWDFAPLSDRALAIAAAPGVVVRIDDNGSKGYGKFVVVEHDTDPVARTWYGHLATADVREGDRVARYEPLGVAGSTGHSSGVHVHLTLQLLGAGLGGYEVSDVVDPAPFLSLEEVAPPTPDPDPNERVLAVDVSHWQGFVDWQKAYNADVRLALIKFTDGISFRDGLSSSNARNAYAKGLIPIPWHFYRAGLDPTRQSKHFIDTISEEQSFLYAPVAVDIEDESSVPPDYADRLHRFLIDVTTATGRRPIIYSREDYWDRYLAHASWAGNYDLWAADPDDKTEPALPAAWDEWLLWQNGFGHGPAYGASSTLIDLDVFNGNLAALKGYVQKLTTLPVLGLDAGFGLHMAADPGDLHPAEFELTHLVQPDVIKVLSAHSGKSVRTLASQHPNATFIIRAFLTFGGRAVTPQQFYEWTLPDVLRAIEAIGPDNEVFVELHNEPNLVSEGLGSAWADGRGFASWVTNVRNLFQSVLPDRIKYMFPGLSPGPAFSGRQQQFKFAEQVRDAIESCDALGIHTYWNTVDGVYPMESALLEVDEFARRFPHMRIDITEASDNKEGGATAKGRAYVEYWRALQRWPNVASVCYYVSRASNPRYRQEVWLLEDGSSRGIGEAVAGR